MVRDCEILMSKGCFEKLKERLKDTECKEVHSGADNKNCHVYKSYNRNRDELWQTECGNYFTEEYPMGMGVRELKNRGINFCKFCGGFLKDGDA